MNALQDALEMIKNSASFIILGHEKPDGDCIASQLVLYEALKKKGKTVNVYSSGPFNRPEIAPFSKFFDSTISNEVIDQKPTVIIVDCSSPDRTGLYEKQILGLQSIIIDHHSSGSKFGDIRMIDSSAPATAYLIQLLLEADNFSLTANQAELLLLGICTDTGFFKHPNATHPKLFEAISRLIDKGASPHNVYNKLNMSTSLEKRHLLGNLLTRTERHLGGNLLFTYQTLRDLELIPKSERGNEELYSLLQTVIDYELLVFAREEEDEVFSVSMRSKNSKDVGEIAESFGGGGHKQAAGFSWKGSIESLREKIIAASLLIG